MAPIVAERPARPAPEAPRRLPLRRPSSSAPPLTGPEPMKPIGRDSQLGSPPGVGAAAVAGDAGAAPKSDKRRYNCSPSTSTVRSWGLSSISFERKLHTTLKPTAPTPCASAAAMASSWRKPRTSSVCKSRSHCSTPGSAKRLPLAQLLVPLLPPAAEEGAGQVDEEEPPALQEGRRRSAMSSMPRKSTTDRNCAKRARKPKWKYTAPQ
mmetsp:Transcript_92488/g.265060  ORF Transcript_92488/g.265060 Transcript_92488/m.265060 type:complete len:209 (+) Transcript_92488:943-1569(+)